MKTLLKQIGLVHPLYRFAVSLRSQYSFNLIRWFKAIGAYIKDYIAYKQVPRNDNFVESARFLYPCLSDRTPNTPIDHVYFYQDCWAAEKIFSINPACHHDVGSSVKTMGIISQFAKTVIIDIRAVDVELKNLTFRKGNILELPFEDNSISSLSSLCVVEHVGLGRYGDPIDQWGSEKAIDELKRVLAIGGNLLISVPVDCVNRVYFNAHRAFTRTYLLKLFDNWELVDEKYIYGNRVMEKYDKQKGFGTGLFHLRKQ